MAFPSGTKSDLEKADYQDYADLEQEERDLELKLVQLQVVEGLQAGGMSDDDEASEAGAAIEISHSPTQGRRISYDVQKINELLGQQDVLRKKLQLLEKKKELEQQLKRLKEEQEHNNKEEHGQPHQSPNSSNKRGKYRHLQQIGQGFWNIRSSFKILAGLVNIGTHMSVCLRANGRFLIIDTAPLSPDALAELKHLTQDGELIDGVIATHPYHTLSFPSFFEAFPTASFYGTPLHLANITHIPWKGETMASKHLFLPDLLLALPAGTEYVNPQPARSNHLCNVFAFHPLSRSVHNDDCVICLQDPPLLMRLMGYRHGDMSFHPSLKGPGLYNTPEAPLAFAASIRQLCEEWDFDNICTAHNGNCIGGAKQKLLQTLRKAEPALEKISARNRNKKAAKDCGSWSSDPKDAPQCG